MPAGKFLSISLCEKGPNTEFFLSAIFYIQTEYLKMWTRKNFVLEYFSVSISLNFSKVSLTLIRLGFSQVIFSGRSI